MDPWSDGIFLIVDAPHVEGDIQWRIQTLEKSMDLDTYLFKQGRMAFCNYFKVIKIFNLL
jgi:hypothetical protein